MSINNEEKKILTAFDKEIMKGTISSIITEIYGFELTNEQVARVLNKLLDYNPTIDSIADRQYDFLIKDFAKPIVEEEKLKANCIGDGELTEFKTKKKKLTTKQKIIAAIAALIAIVIALYATYVNSDTYENKQIVKTAIEELQADGVDIDNIVKNHTSKYENSDEILNKYDHGKIAKDIIDIAKNKPDVLEVAIHQVYVDIEKDPNVNACEEMNEIFSSIGYYVGEDSDEFLKARFENCSNFIEFLVTYGYISQTHPDYMEILEIIKDMRVYDRVSSLTSDQERIIKQVLKDYKNLVVPYQNIVNSYNPSIITNLSNAEVAYGFEFEEPSPDQGGRK